MKKDIKLNYNSSLPLNNLVIKRMERLKFCFRREDIVFQILEYITDIS